MQMGFIPRRITKELKILLQEYPVVTILGPRQSGKTTLVRTVLKKYKYVNLEHPEQRLLAKTDPETFLNNFSGALLIIDEVQRVPELLSYIQVTVDENNVPGQFVLTGSQNFNLSQHITQSLAGRVGVLTLLPLSISELKGSHITYEGFENYICNGFLPRVHDKKQRPFNAYANYYTTYVERDIRQLINIKEHGLFEKFMKLLAGRVGRVFNYASLSRDVGVSVKTITNWLSILETSFIIFKLHPYFKNFGKRIIKSPKYYFVEVGLLAFLLDLKLPSHVTRDPLVGSLFENLVVIDMLKNKLNNNSATTFYFYRDSNGNEIDLLYEEQSSLKCFEIKTTATCNQFLISKLNKKKSILSNKHHLNLIYTGKSKKISKEINLLNFKSVTNG